MIFWLTSGIVVMTIIIQKIHSCRTVFSLSLPPLFTSKYFYRHEYHNILPPDFNTLYYTVDLTVTNVQIKRYRVGWWLMVSTGILQLIFKRNIIIPTFYLAYKGQILLGIGIEFEPINMILYFYIIWLFVDQIYNTFPPTLPLIRHHK